MLRLILIALIMTSCGAVDQFHKKTELPKWCVARIQCTDSVRYPDRIAYRFLQETQHGDHMEMSVDTYNVKGWESLGTVNKVSNNYVLDNGAVGDCLPDYENFVKPATEECKYQGELIPTK